MTTRPGKLPGPGMGHQHVRHADGGFHGVSQPAREPDAESGAEQ